MYVGDILLQHYFYVIKQRCIHCEKWRRTFFYVPSWNNSQMMKKYNSHVEILFLYTYMYASQ
jgi:hypothetical protein